MSRPARPIPEAPAILDTLFETSSIALAYCDRELRYVRVTQEFADIDGIARDEHAGRPVTGEELVAACRRAIDTAEPSTGIETWDEWLADAHPVKDAQGAVLGVALLVEGRDRAHERAHRFLARASALLDQSLDPDVTLATVAELAVEQLADWCSVEVRDADGTLRHVATAHADPARVELASTLRERYPPDPDATIGAPNVVRTGRSELYPEVTDELLSRTARDEERLALARSLGMRSAMVVPMTFKGKTIGAITLVSAESGRRFDEDDLLLAEDLGRRAAGATEAARLYTERAAIARTLQESLLPPHIPQIDGFEVAARYTAAGEGNEVGGDFYDVFVVAPSEWAVVIGDVCGKGAEAAALTALVRYTIRALATRERKPSEVLELVNSAILRQREDSRFCTVAYARLTLRGEGGARVAFSNGGHPLPVVIRADGSAQPFGEPGTLLGVVPDPRLTDHTIELAPGDGLVLYTDGVTEARAPDVLLEPPDVARVVEECRPDDAADLARRTEEAVLDEERPTPQDDIAILVMRALVPEQAGAARAFRSLEAD